MFIKVTYCIKEICSLYVLYTKLSIIYVYYIYALVVYWQNCVKCVYACQSGVFYDVLCCFLSLGYIAHPSLLRCKYALYP